jgi:hypothetical protein
MTGGRPCEHFQRAKLSHSTGPDGVCALYIARELTSFEQP